MPTDPQTTEAQRDDLALVRKLKAENIALQAKAAAAIFHARRWRDIALNDKRLGERN